MNPLVSIICLCYNHDRFVVESLESVLAQTYQNIQLIVVDDASKDQSVARIKDWLLKHPSITFLPIPANLGNCRAFNHGLSRAQGDFIIDLSGDDVLLPTRVAEGVKSLTVSGDAYGVHFCDAELIDGEGKSLGFHSDRFPHTSMPQGDVYKEVVSRYFINSPTMMIRRSVFDKLGGYDESLAYEDFDFWIRSARDFKYAYQPEVLIKRRILPSSMSRQQYKPGSRQLGSTLRVLEKALTLNRNSEENAALRERITYEMRQALKLGALGLAWKYFLLRGKVPV